MKKVLFIYKFLPQYRIDFFQQLRSNLYTYDIELNLIYGNSNKIDALKRDEIIIGWAEFIPNKRFYFGKTELLWQPCLSKLKDKDLVIVQNESKLLLNYFLMVARKFLKYKLAFWNHVYNMQDDQESLRNKFKLLFLRKCDWWFGYTMSAKKYLLNKNYPSNKITVVQNAIDTHRLIKWYEEINEVEIIQLKEQFGIIGDNTGIFCSGMYHEKRLDFIIETCFRVRKEIPDFHMIFIGSGIESNKVSEVSKLCNWIHYVGPKFGRERVIYFKISSLQLMPGLVGLGILDSFALETPIVTTEYKFHSPEIEYLENDINGCITPDNINDYSGTVIDLLKSKRYLDLIVGCNSSAKTFTIEVMVENFTNGILSCLNRR